jgi:hypothetical protein
MSVTLPTAQKLGTVQLKNADIDRIVDEQISAIAISLNKKDKILGRNVVEHELPTTFVINGISKRDTQRIIYSFILNNIKDAGYDVKILMQPTTTKLFIAWNVSFDEEELKTMNMVIAKASIDIKEVKEFVSKKKSSTNTRTPKTAATATAAAARPPQWATSAAPVAPSTEYVIKQQEGTT